MTARAGEHKATSQYQQHHPDLAGQLFIPLRSLAIPPTVDLKEEEKTCPQLFCLVSFCILMPTETITNYPSMHFSALKLTPFLFLSSKC